MDGFALDPSPPKVLDLEPSEDLVSRFIHESRIAGRLETRVLRRQVGHCPVGTVVKAMFHREHDGTWRVSLLRFEPEYPPRLSMIGRSKALGTRERAVAWLRYRTRRP